MTTSIQWSSESGTFEIASMIINIKSPSIQQYFWELYPGQSHPAVNGRILIIYDGKRPLFTVTPYGSHIRCFTVYYAHPKQ